MSSIGPNNHNYNHNNANNNSENNSINFIESYRNGLEQEKSRIAQTSWLNTDFQESKINGLIEGVDMNWNLFGLVTSDAFISGTSLEGGDADVGVKFFEKFLENLLQKHETQTENEAEAETEDDIQILGQKNKKTCSLLDNSQIKASLEKFQKEMAYSKRIFARLNQMIQQVTIISNNKTSKEPQPTQLPQHGANVDFPHQEREDRQNPSVVPSTAVSSTYDQEQQDLIDNYAEELFDHVKEEREVWIPCGWANQPDENQNSNGHTMMIHVDFNKNTVTIVNTGAELDRFHPAVKTNVVDPLTGKITEETRYQEFVNIKNIDPKRLQDKDFFKLFIQLMVIPKWDGQDGHHDKNGTELYYSIQNYLKGTIDYGLSPVDHPEVYKKRQRSKTSTFKSISTALYYHLLKLNDKENRSSKSSKSIDVNGNVNGEVNGVDVYKQLKFLWQTESLVVMSKKINNKLTHAEARLLKDVSANIARSAEKLKVKGLIDDNKLAELHATLIDIEQKIADVNLDKTALLATEDQTVKAIPCPSLREADLTWRGAIWVNDEEITDVNNDLVDDGDVNGIEFSHQSMNDKIIVSKAVVNESTLKAQENKSNDQPFNDPKTIQVELDKMVSDAKEICEELVQYYQSLKNSYPDQFNRQFSSRSPNLQIIKTKFEEKKRLVQDKLEKIFIQLPIPSKNPLQKEKTQNDIWGKLSDDQVVPAMRSVLELVTLLREFNKNLDYNQYSYGYNSSDSNTFHVFNPHMKAMFYILYSIQTSLAKQLPQSKLKDKSKDKSVNYKEIIYEMRSKNFIIMNSKLDEKLHEAVQYLDPKFKLQDLRHKEEASKGVDDLSSGVFSFKVNSRTGYQVGTLDFTNKNNKTAQLFREILLNDILGEEGRKRPERPERSEKVVQSENKETPETTRIAETAEIAENTENTENTDKTNADNIPVEELSLAEKFYQITKTEENHSEERKLNALLGLVFYQREEAKKFIPESVLLLMDTAMNLQFVHYLPNNQKYIDTVNDKKKFEEKLGIEQIIPYRQYVNNNHMYYTIHQYRELDSMKQDHLEDTRQYKNLKKELDKLEEEYLKDIENQRAVRRRAPFYTPGFIENDKTRYSYGGSGSGVNRDVTFQDVMNEGSYHHPLIKSMDQIDSNLVSEEEDRVTPNKFALREKTLFNKTVAVSRELEMIGCDAYEQAIGVASFIKKNKTLLNNDDLLKVLKYHIFRTGRLRSQMKDNPDFAKTFDESILDAIDYFKNINDEKTCLALLDFANSVKIYIEKLGIDSKMSNYREIILGTPNTGTPNTETPNGLIHHFEKDKVNGGNKVAKCYEQIVRFDLEIDSEVDVDDETKDQIVQDILVYRLHCGINGISLMSDMTRVNELFGSLEQSQLKVERPQFHQLMNGVVKRFFPNENINENESDNWEINQSIIQNSRYQINYRNDHISNKKTGKMPTKAPSDLLSHEVFKKVFKGKVETINKKITKYQDVIYTINEGKDDELIIKKINANYSSYTRYSFQKKIDGKNYLYVDSSDIPSSFNNSHNSTDEYWISYSEKGQKSNGRHILAFKQGVTRPHLKLMLNSKNQVQEIYAIDNHGKVNTERVLIPTSVVHDISRNNSNVTTATSSATSTATSTSGATSTATSISELSKFCPVDQMECWGKKNAEGSSEKVSFDTINLKKCGKSFSVKEVQDVGVGNQFTTPGSKKYLYSQQYPGYFLIEKEAIALLNKNITKHKTRSEDTIINSEDNDIGNDTDIDSGNITNSQDIKTNTDNDTDTHPEAELAQVKEAVNREQKIPDYLTLSNQAGQKKILIPFGVEKGPSTGRSADDSSGVTHWLEFDVKDGDLHTNKIEGQLFKAKLLIEDLNYEAALDIIDKLNPLKAFDEHETALLQLIIRGLVDDKNPSASALFLKIVVLMLDNTLSHKLQNLNYDNQVAIVFEKYNQYYSNLQNTPKCRLSEKEELMIYDLINESLLDTNVQGSLILKLEFDRRFKVRGDYLKTKKVVVGHRIFTIISPPDVSEIRYPGFYSLKANFEYDKDNKNYKNIVDGYAEVTTVENQDEESSDLISISESDFDNDGLEIGNIANKDDNNVAKKGSVPAIKKSLAPFKLPKILRQRNEFFDENFFHLYSIVLNGTESQIEHLRKIISMSSIHNSANGCYHIIKKMLDNSSGYPSIEKINKAQTDLDEAMKKEKEALDNKDEAEDKFNKATESRDHWWDALGPWRRAKANVETCKRRLDLSLYYKKERINYGPTVEQASGEYQKAIEDYKKQTAESEPIKERYQEAESKHKKALIDFEKKEAIYNNAKAKTKKASEYQDSLFESIIPSQLSQLISGTVSKISAMIKDNFFKFSIFTNIYDSLVQTFKRSHVVVKMKNKSVSAQDKKSDDSKNTLKALDEQYSTQFKDLVEKYFNSSELDIDTSHDENLDENHRSAEANPSVKKKIQKENEELKNFRDNIQVKKTIYRLNEGSHSLNLTNLENELTEQINEVTETLKTQKAALLWQLNEVPEQSQERSLKQVRKFGTGDVLSWDDLRQITLKGDLETFKKRTHLSEKQAEILMHEVSKYLIMASRVEQMEAALTAVQKVLDLGSDSNSGLSSWNSSLSSSSNFDQENTENTKQLTTQNTTENSGETKKYDILLQTIPTILTIVRAYEPNQNNLHNQWFEYANHYLYREMQIQKIKEVTDRDFKEILAEMPTGFGKTKALIPTIDFMKGKEGKLVINTWPGSLEMTNATDVQEQYRESFGEKVDRFSFDRSTQFSAKSLKHIYHKLLKNIKHGRPVNIRSESFRALELHAILMLKQSSEVAKIDNEMRGQIEYILKILTLIRRKGWAAIDESHINLDPVDKLIYTLGSSEVLSNVQVNVLEKFFEILTKEGSKFDQLLKIKNNQQSFISDKTYNEIIMPELANMFFNELNIAEGKDQNEAESEKIKNEFLSYVTDGAVKSGNSVESSAIESSDASAAPDARVPSTNETPSIPEWIKNHRKKEEIALVKGMLTQVLRSSLKGSVDENYGLSKLHIDKKEYAISYASANTPKENEHNPSQFKNPHETMAKTYMTYLHKGLSEGQVIRLIDFMKDQEAKEQKGGDTFQNTEAWKFFNRMIPEYKKPLAMLTENEKASYAKQLTQNKEAIFYYIRHIIVLQLKLYPDNLVSTVHNFRTQMTSSLSLSATPQDTATHGRDTKFVPMRGTSGQVTHLLLTKCKDPKTLHAIGSVEPKDALDETLNIVANNERMHAIIDIGANFKGMSNIQVANAIREKFSNIDANGTNGKSDEVEGVLFFDESDGLFKIMDMASGQIHNSSDHKADPAKIKTFFDQSRCFGSDTKQAVNAVGLMMSGIRTTKADAGQAGGRMRQWTKDQVVEVAYPRVQSKEIFGTDENGTAKEANIKDLLTYWLVNQAKKEEEQNYQSQIQQMDNETRRACLDKILGLKVKSPEKKASKDIDVDAAIDMFAKFKSEFVTKDSNSAWSLYGPVSAEQSAIESLEDHKIFCINKVKSYGGFSREEKRYVTERLEGYSEKWDKMALPEKVRKQCQFDIECEVLQELEVNVEQQVEVQQQVQVERSLRPISHWNENIDLFAKGWEAPKIPSSFTMKIDKIAGGALTSLSKTFGKLGEFFTNYGKAVLCGLGVSLVLTASIAKIVLAVTAVTLPIFAGPLFGVFAAVGVVILIGLAISVIRARKNYHDYYYAHINDVNNGNNNKPLSLDDERIVAHDVFRVRDLVESLLPYQVAKAKKVFSSNLLVSNNFYNQNTATLMQKKQVPFDIEQKPVFSVVVIMDTVQNAVGENVKDVKKTFKIIVIDKNDSPFFHEKLKADRENTSEDSAKERTRKVGIYDLAKGFFSVEGKNAFDAADIEDDQFKELIAEVKLLNGEIDFDEENDKPFLNKLDKVGQKIGYESVQGLVTDHILSQHPINRAAMMNKINKKPLAKAMKMHDL